MQDVGDALRTEGSASTIHNKIDPLRVLYRRALHRDEVTADPTHGLELPTNRGHRDRIESLGAPGCCSPRYPETERPLRATALYAGLWIGELRALRWRCVDFDAGVIRVEHAGTT